MDINNNQQINTFLKGMNTDVSDALIDSSQYRYAENLRLVTNTDSNTGELHMVEGTIIRYGMFAKLITSDENDVVEILYLTSIRNYVIVILKNATDETWSIVVSDNNGSDFTLIFGPCSEPIWNEDGICSVSGVCRWESENNVKLYFTDNTGKHGIMSVFINNKKWPDLIENSSEQVPTSFEELTGYQEVAIKKLDISISNLPGHVKAARVQYAYRLYKYGGAATSISPLSKILSLYKSNNYEGYLPSGISERAVDINLQYQQGEINPSLNRIQIFRINYIQQGQEPTIHLIYDDSFSGTISLTDTGINIEQFALVDFLSFIQMRIKPKLIESKGDYLYAANIKYAQDDVDKTLGIDTDTVSGLDVSYGYTDLETLNLKNNQYDYTEQYKTTLRRGETYRYGVIFYDEKGRASSVKWAGDLDVPNWGEGDIVFDSQYNEIFKARRVYAKVTVPYIQGCKGFEVVRCLRNTENKKILFQGMIGFPQETIVHVDKDNNLTNVQGKCAPSGLITMQNMGYKYHPYDMTGAQPLGESQSTEKILQFVCPEYVYQPDDFEDILRAYKDQIKIKHVISYNIRSRSVKVGSNLLCGPYTQHSQIGQLFKMQKSNGSNGDKLLYDLDCVPNANQYIPDPVAVNHVVPSAINTNPNYIFQDTKIQDISFAKSANYKHWQNLDDVSFQDDSTPISGVEYINWTAPTYLHYSSSDIEHFARPLVHIGAGGMVTLIKPQTTTNRPVASASGSDSPLWVEGNYQQSVHLNDEILPITIVNIVNDGADYTYKPYSQYYSFGNYYEMPSANPNDSISVDVFDGDAYIQAFNYNASYYAGFYTREHAEDSIGWKEWTLCSVYTIPIETDIDLRAQCGQRFIDEDNYFIQEEPSNLPNGYTQTIPAYVYNTAYNQEAITVSKSSDEYVDIDADQYDTRIHHSKLKTNGEHIDSWLEFKTADYLDVDSRFGAITQLKLFKDRLMYWQCNATGIIAANDKTVIADIDNNQLVLGNGDIMQRYDYITTIYGMKPNQFADTQSNTTLYWWDGSEKEILAFGEGQGIVPLATLKGVKNYINERSESNEPHLFYDNKYKELVSNAVNNESLVYNEQVEAFTSVYKFTPLFSTITEGELLVANKEQLDVYSIKEGLFENSSLFGEEVYPLLKYVVNNQNTYNKVFDITTFGGRFYGGDDLSNLTFTFDTPLKQHSVDNGNSCITNREYDFRLNIPRNNNSSYGDRMRGKTMQCELKSSSSSTDFSLQYIITKYRMSWS